MRNPKAGFGVSRPPGAAAAALSPLPPDGPEGAQSGSRRPAAAAPCGAPAGTCGKGRPRKEPISTPPPPQKKNNDERRGGRITCRRPYVLYVRCGCAIGMYGRGDGHRGVAHGTEGPPALRSPRSSLGSFRTAAPPDSSAPTPPPQNAAAHNVRTAMSATPVPPLTPPPPHPPASTTPYHLLARNWVYLYLS